MDVNSQQAIEPFTNFQQPETSDPRDKLIAQLTQQAQQLMDKLRQAREQITYLTSNFNKQSKGNDPRNSNNPSPSIGSPKPQNSPDVSQAPWHNPSKLAATKQSLLIHNQKNRHHKEEIASRFFQPPSPNQGYKYLYVHTKSRILVGRLRSYLRQMGVNNARVLDIHYLDRNIAALLLHNEYAADFQKLLESKRVHFVNNFDPWDGSILKDPQYLEMTSQDRSLKAAKLQQQRLQRAINHIREPIKYAVAYYFHRQQWISKEFIDQLNTSRYGQPADVFDIDDMDAISDNYSHSF
ncbi:hypothetical protein INT46_010207 [Mucor plumbeus]|uniref:Uncharacterized protein n=1 Tax=Mucor plumbeus TaxID=97098 RepID=A0A8H7V0T5_9FUNG|nr:hypothetical protein INT46_010207 [Mucor plumbeus]